MKRDTSSVVSIASSDGASSTRSSRSVKVDPAITGRPSFQSLVVTVVRSLELMLVLVRIMVVARSICSLKGIFSIRSALRVVGTVTGGTGGTGRRRWHGRRFVGRRCRQPAVAISGGSSAGGSSSRRFVSRRFVSRGLISRRFISRRFVSRRFVSRWFVGSACSIALAVHQPAVRRCRRRRPLRVEREHRVPHARRAGCSLHWFRRRARPGATG